MAKKLYIGLGGAGISIIKTASSKQISNENILLVNADQSSLDESTHYRSVLIGKQILKGHCAGSIRFGEKAIDESFIEIINHIEENDFKQIIIMAGVGGGTGGNAAYLANKLLIYKLSVGLCLSDIFTFETGSLGDNASLAIKQAKKIKEKLLFLKIFRPTKLVAKLSITKDENLADFIDKLNHHICIFLDKKS
jgi:cell division protein FtsZ